jgi:uncharacterized membrane protein (UPF0127 family)
METLFQVIKRLASVNPDFRRLQCNGVTIWARVADTDKTRQKGLAGVSTLGDNQGMLFDFHHEQPVSFWMRGTCMDLSIAFLTENRIIVGMTDMSKDAPTHLHSSPVPVRYALEVPKGFFMQHNIAIGDKISF